VKHREAPGRAVEQVDDIVEERREHMNVLAIDRRDEALVDALIERQREQVGFVLDVLDRLHVIVDMRRIAKERIEQLRGRGEMACQLVEELEELVVAWE